MTALEVSTALAIGVLVIGSAAIFVWFLFDVARELRERREGRDR